MREKDIILTEPYTKEQIEKMADENGYVESIWQLGGILVVY